MDFLWQSFKCVPFIVALLTVFAIISHNEINYSSITYLNVFYKKESDQPCNSGENYLSSGIDAHVNYYHNLNKPCYIPPLIILEHFYDYGKREKSKCDNLVEVGGVRSLHNDGSKFVCFDDRFKIIPGSCVVLSFGISNEWSFDDAMDKYGCDVYSFDPTMGVDDFDRSPRIHFFNLGLSHFDGQKKIGRKLCPVDRYENILHMLNLTDTQIDYLKMDIEGSEIDFFYDIFNRSSHLLKNIKQISMEIHTQSPNHLDDASHNLLRSNFYSLWKGMHLLECHGFKLLHFEKNNVKSNHYRYKDREESYCYEVVWVKDPF